MNINIKVKHSGINFEKFQNTNNNVVNVTESAGLGFASMMKASAPVNSQIW